MPSVLCEGDGQIQFCVGLDKLERKTKLTNITNLSLLDEEFVYNVSGDIENFIKKRHSSSVLLFPPVNNFRRFLIHQACEQFREQYDLFTFSVGQGPYRRTVVCFRTQLLDPHKLADTAAAANFESPKKSPANSWRSERTKTEVCATNHTTTATATTSTTTTSPLTGRLQKSASTVKMGVERNGSEARANKTISMDIYRPPPLRNHNYYNNSDTVAETATVTATTTTAKFIRSGSVNATATTVAASAAGVPTSANISSTKTITKTTSSRKIKTTTAPIATAVNKAALSSPTTSISCNNSPTHVNVESNSSNKNTALVTSSRCVATPTPTITSTAPATATTTKPNALMINSDSPAIGAMPTATTTTTSGSISCQQRQTSAVRRERRPDRAVYIPRARRSQTTPPTAPTTTTTAPTAVQVTDGVIQQQQHHQIPAITASSTTTTATAAGASMPPPCTAAATAGNNNGASRSQNQLANISEATAPSLVYKTASTKLDEISGNRGMTATTTSANSVYANAVNNVVVGNSVVKKTKSSSSASVSGRERRERSKKSSSSGEGQEAKIKKISLERSEIRTHVQQQQQQQQQQNGHDLIAFTTDTQQVNIIKNNKDTLCNQQKLQQQQQQLEQQIFQPYYCMNIENSQRIPTYCEQQQQHPSDVIRKQITAEPPKTTTTTNITSVHNEMNSNSIATANKRSGNKVKNSNSGNVKNANKLQNLRIEDVAATKVNGTRIDSTTKCDIEAQEFQRASKEINRSNRRIIKQTFVSDVLEIPEKVEQNSTATNGTDARRDQRIANNIKAMSASTANRSVMDSATEEEDDEEGGEEEDGDWESMYDDSGECLDPKIMQELTSSLGKVKIELPKMDYSAYLSKQSILNDEEFPHVLEVSNFPVEFKNHDLLMVFSQYKESGFDIKWVDDTHALAVFSSSRIAAEVLSMGHPFVVLKPLAEATVESRLKAKKCAASLQPYRQRPETCAALARRLVSGALGVRLKTDAAERENEKRVLREAKERKMLAAKQRDEIWES